MKGLDNLLTGAPGASIYLVGSLAGGASESYAVNAGTATDYVGLYARNSGHIGMIAIKGGSSVCYYQSARYSDSWGIWSGRAKFSDGSSAVKPQRLNGTDLFGTNAGSADVSGLTLPSGQVAIGGVIASAGLSPTMTARFVVVFPDALSDADDAQLAALLAAASGTTKVSLAGVPYFDSAPAVPGPGYDIVSVYSSIVGTTTSDQLQLLTVEKTDTPQYTIAVTVDGVRSVIDVATIAYPGISLGNPGVSKTVAIEVGPQTLNVTPPNAGSYLKELWLPPGYSFIPSTPTPPAHRCVVLFDSILQGQKAGQSQAGGAGIAWRAAYATSTGGGRTTFLAGGTFSFYDMCFVRFASPAAFAAAVIAQADGTVGNDLLDQLSTNDFGKNQWVLVSDYQAAKTTFYSIVGPYFGRIWKQTAGPRTDEPTNGRGQTLAQFRAADAAAVSASGFGVIIDGTTLYTLGDSDDSIHPGPIGQSDYGTNLPVAAGL